MMDCTNLSDDEQRECSLLFHKLQPLCVNFAKNQSLVILTSLYEEIKDIDGKYLRVFQEFILFPLRLTLMKYPNICEKVLCLMLDGITVVVTKAPVTKWSLLSELFNSLCRIFGMPGLDKGTRKLTEEVTIAVTKCLTAVVSHSDLISTTQIFQPVFLPALGHAVSTLLSLVEHAPTPTVQLGALDSLSALLQCRHDDDVLGQLIADRFATFLPGASTTLCRVITKQSGQGHSVTEGSLRFWSRLLCRVMTDTLMNRCAQEPQKPNNSVVHDERIGQLLVKRDSEWRKETGQKISILIGHLPSLMSHSHWKVRQAVVKFADSLLAHCFSSLSACSPRLLEILVAGCRDDYVTVSRPSHDAVRAYRLNRDARPLLEILEENLYELVSSLPRQIRVSNDNDKLQSLTVLLGYLELLGADVGRVLRSSVHLHRLMIALIQALEVDCSLAKIVQERMFHPAETLLQSDQHGQTVRMPVKSYTHFRDERIEKCLHQICATLGRNGDPYILVDHLTTTLSDHNPYITGTLLVTNNIIAGLKDNSESTQRLVRGLVSDYLSGLRACSVAQTPTASVTSSIRELNADVVKSCLYLEGLAAFSQMFKGQLETYLMDVLYPTLQHLGHENAAISTTAYLTLIQLCDVASYKDVSTLLEVNSDYLVNSLSLRLRHLSPGRDVTRVLCVTLQFAAPSLLPLLHSLIYNILESLDSRHLENTEDFVAVLRQLVSSIRRWFVQEKDDETKETKPHETGRISDRVTSLIESHHKNWVIAHERIDQDSIDGDDDDDNDGGDGDDGDDGGDDGDATPQNEDKDVDGNKKLPLHLELVKEVLTRCKHLLSCDGMRARLLVLDTIRDAACVFASNTGALLPLVHQLWESFVPRFSDKNTPVIIKAVETLLSLSETCGDFIRHRTTTRVLPCLLSVLHGYKQNSYGRPKNWQFSSSYKLQLCLLSRLGKLCRLLGLTESHVSQVVDACIPYLDTHQPLALQNACSTTLREIASVYPDIVWRALLPMGIGASLEAPHDDLECIKFPQENPDYQDNVRLICDSL